MLALQESYVQGVATRKVKKVTEKLCGTSFSKSLVSKLCQDLDAEIEAWRNRPLTQCYPYLIVDARYEHIRDNGRVLSKGVLTVKGISESGYREILAVDVANTESEPTWGELFGTLKARGLKGVLLVTSDEHKGLLKALQRHFQGVRWQHCQTHFQRNVRDLVPRSQQAALAEGLRKVFAADTLDEATTSVNAPIESYQDRSPKLADKLDEDMDQSALRKSRNMLRRY